MKSVRRDHGFSAVELAAVLAATAVVGAVGVSAYRTHTVRTEIATAVAAAATVQRHVEHAFATSGVVPTTRALLEKIGTPPGALLAGIEIVDGRIDLTFGPEADRAIAGKTLSLTPFETADQQVVWICGNRVPGVGLAPLGFAGGGPQAVQVLTAIETHYLPSACR